MIITMATMTTTTIAPNTRIIATTVFEVPSPKGWEREGERERERVSE